MVDDSSNVDQKRLVIQRNNEAVILMQIGEFNEARKHLMNALRDFRSFMPRPGDESSNDRSSMESFSLDQWMVSSTEALHTRLSEAATHSFFVYPKGILIPINFFQDNANRYCDVDVSAAISSVICFNQGLACQLAHIRAPSTQSRDVQSLQKASELYRLSIQGTRQREKRMSSQANSATNANFLIAAMNNLAVAERMYDVISNSSKPCSTTAGKVEPVEVNYQHFETLRSFLISWRPPSTSNSPDEVLWISYLENVLRGCDLEQSNYCVIPA